MAFSVHKTYQELLTTDQWRAMRVIILTRDGYRCQGCYNDRITSELRTVLPRGYRPLPNGKKVLITLVDGEMLFLEECDDKPNYFVVYLSPNKETRGSTCPWVGKMPADAYLEFKRQKEIGQLSSFDRWLEVRGLHVHHTYYQVGKRPWEYPEHSLITLCGQCHSDLHGEVEIPIMDSFGALLHPRILVPCWKCDGTGYLPEYWYHENGVCYGCEGKRYDL